MPKEYDVLVVGSGTAGQTAAVTLKRSGLSVALAEQSDRPGGTCALRGCQAKKWFYETAEVVARSRHLSGIGIQTPAAGDWRTVRDQKNDFTSEIPAGTVQNLKEAGIDYISGQARFVDRQTITVDGHPIPARFIVLATGAKPMSLPFEGASHLTTSTQYMELDQLPASIVFVGGGFISFEFAHFAVRLGPPDIRCTILEAGPRCLGPFDGEMVDLLVSASQQEGIDIRTDINITAVEKSERGYTVVTEKGRRFTSDLVVNGAGRAPNIEDLALERAGIEFSDHGIEVDEHMATANPRIYAVGDCAASVQLARVSDYEARVAAANISGRLNGVSVKTFAAKAVMDYTNVPSTLFTYPQYGMVGATEDALKEKGVTYKKSFQKSIDWPTYRRVGLKSAAYKILAEADGTILGAHFLADHTTGVINTFAMAMTNGLSVETLYHQSILTPYPSRESDMINMLEPLFD